ncbi:hypothetical protein K438DRAFT_1865733 [Mycena galopus ATCC 62051]|nr:hypothetical protein K438DRAFT_1865733 [Mycena galopus ATCC 62051]
MDSAAADRARLAEIDIEILSLECSLSSLRKQRAQVQERLDSCRYPVLTLPTEITSKVFSHFLPVYPACPPLIGPSSPTLLTQICRHWRQIAVATSELWRAISFADDWDDVLLEEELHICQIWLTRSRSYPLAIRDVSGQDPARVLEAIIPHRARWEYLYLHHPSYLAHIQDPMPLLRHLHLTMYDELDDIVTFSSAPLLRSITLSASTPLKFAFPLGQLTSLALTYASRSEYTTILQQTCNLIHCELGVVFDYDLPLEYGVKLLCLESLNFYDNDNFQVLGPKQYLDDFTVPALRSLRVPESFLRPKPIDRLSSFIANSGCKLLEVCVTGRTSISEASYCEAFPSIPQFSFDDDSDAASISTDSS